MRALRSGLLLGTALLGATLLGATNHPAAASGIVSLNLCADDYLLTLAPTRIAALTVLARDPTLSVDATAAHAYKQVRADPEAVLALHPDLVLAAAYGAQATLAVLRAQGVPIVLVGQPTDFAQIRAETRRLAALLGVPARGEAVLAAMDRTLSTLPPPQGRSALFLEPRGWTGAGDSLAAAVLRAAGDRPLGDGRDWSLEQVVVQRPDLLVIPAAPAFPSLATEVLRHPVLRNLPVRTIAPALLACGGPWTARAVQRLAAP